MDIFAEIKEYYKPELEQVNAIFQDIAGSDVELMKLILNHLISSGGKRVRPLLTIICAHLISLQSDKLPFLAASVECIHAATLLHDDVIDGSMMRRGAKTANNIWGNKASILVGDFLLGKAFQLLVSADSLEALRLFSDTSVKLAEAEIWQLAILKESEPIPALDAYMKLIEGKTSMLFSAACTSPSLLLNGEHYNRLAEFGLNLGHLFQLIDDTLDYYSPDPKFGKELGNDILEGKATLPYLMMLSQHPDPTKIREAFAIRNKDYILSEFNKHDILESCRKYYTKYHDICIEILTEFEDSIHKQFLIKILTFLLNRTY